MSREISKNSNNHNKSLVSLLGGEKEKENKSENEILNDRSDEFHDNFENCVQTTTRTLEKIQPYYSLCHKYPHAIENRYENPVVDWGG